MNEYNQNRLRKQCIQQTELLEAIIDEGGYVFDMNPQMLKDLGATLGRTVEAIRTDFRALFHKKQIKLVQVNDDKTRRYEITYLEPERTAVLGSKVGKRADNPRDSERPRAT